LLLRTGLRLLAISGSLRARSSNTALLKAAEALARPLAAVSLYDGLADLPHFNPDHDGEVPPPAVAAWRLTVGCADGLLISSPEYARGIPGSLKNALDWLVGDPDFAGKPVALFNASQRAVDAQRALLLTLQTMSAHIIDSASITVPLTGRAADVGDILADQGLTDEIRRALEALRCAVQDRRAGSANPETSSTGIP